MHGGHGLAIAHPVLGKDLVEEGGDAVLCHAFREVSDVKPLGLPVDVRLRVKAHRQWKLVRHATWKGQGSTVMRERSSLVGREEGHRWRGVAAVVREVRARVAADGEAAHALHVHGTEMLATWGRNVPLVDGAVPLVQRNHVLPEEKRKEQRNINCRKRRIRKRKKRKEEANSLGLGLRSAGE